MDEKLIKKIRQHMEPISTEELEKILNEESRKEYAEERYEAIRRILADRQNPPSKVSTTTQTTFFPSHTTRLISNPIRFMGAILILIGIWMLFATIFRTCGTFPPTSSNVYNSEPPQAEEMVQPQIPQKQLDFTRIVELVQAEYAVAPNELKKSAIRTKRKNLLRSFFNENYTVKNWVGTLAGMETNRQGKAIIYIQLEGSKIKVQTHNNAFSDLGDNTLISQENSLYSTIAEMYVGQQVFFSGKFLPDEQDCVQEISVREEGSMLNPEFIFKFKDIQSYQSYREETKNREINSSISRIREIERDERFIVYSDGTVLDMKTNLMWAGEDNGSDIKWNDAKIYCENYRGGDYSDWRMPTLDELAGLYDSTKPRAAPNHIFFNIHVVTGFIDITGLHIWALETNGYEAASVHYAVSHSNWSWCDPSRNNDSRALPVRSSK
jgi:hypothetical protein